jgi:hypothetical protein
MQMQKQTQRRDAGADAFEGGFLGAFLVEHVTRELEPKRRRQEVQEPLKC